MEDTIVLLCVSTMDFFPLLLLREKQHGKNAALALDNMDNIGYFAVGKRGVKLVFNGY